MAECILLLATVTKTKRHEKKPNKSVFETSTHMKFKDTQGDSCHDVFLRLSFCFFSSSMFYFNLFKWSEGGNGDEVSLCFSFLLVFSFFLSSVVCIFFLLFIVFFLSFFLSVDYQEIASRWFFFCSLAQLYTRPPLHYYFVIDSFIQSFLLYHHHHHHFYSSSTPS